MEALGHSVEIQHIEKEFHQLREADSARTNASLMNFAVYSEAAGALQQNSEMVREITREHACRAILVELDKSVEEPSIEAWITAHCHLAYGQKSVCSEQVSFYLAGTSKGRFSNTIFAALQSDLPLIFWWQGDLSDIFNEGLYRRINRLIIDSSEWSDVKAGYQRINEAWKAFPGLVVQDLEWSRTYHYRLAVAGMYDDPKAQSSLNATQRVQVIAHPKHSQSAVLLVSWFCDLAGWVRSQDLLGEEGSSESGYRFAKQDGGLVDVYIQYAEDSAPIGKFEVIASDVRVQVSREQGEDYLHHRLECGTYLYEAHGQADSDDQAEVVAHQLSRGGKNSLYKRIFPKLVRHFNVLD